MTPTPEGSRTDPAAPPAVRILGTALLVAILVGGLGPDPACAEPHPDLREFLPTGTYVLQVEGKAAPKAKIFHSTKATAYLILDDAFDVGVLLLQRNRCVEAVDKEKIEDRDDGGIDVTRDADPCGLGKFNFVGKDVAFTVKAKKVRLKLKPPLLGTHWSKKLVEHMPEYGRAAARYKPDPAKVEALAKVDEETRVQIFFGTWCSFCTKFLPNTLALERELKKAGGKITFEFHGLPPPPAAWSTKEALQMRVRRLPTGLIFSGRKLIGRLEGNDWIKPEASLARVIK
jgi:hypothetical protein